ncbi:MAG: hypothetical protein JKP95_00100 [Oceanicaulis sp.]|nr:hypothetical protein [Oceanicaulis sp.]
MRLTKASSPVARGDQLVIRRGDAPFRLVILDLPERRGPAVEAQACYSLATD